MAKSRIALLAAWGQYLHWAHLQFERYATSEEHAHIAERTATVAHWLASEYVALEGWKELGLAGKNVSKLITLYPEHVETLRRCRNAVYHFQKELLDERIAKCLRNEAEELTWAVALHEEFQRYLVVYLYNLNGSFKEQAEVADEVAATIGWFPEKTVTGAQFRIKRKCLKFEEMLDGNRSIEAEDGRKLIAETMKKVVELTSDEHLVALSRWATAGEA